MQYTCARLRQRFRAAAVIIQIAHYSVSEHRVFILYYFRTRVGPGQHNACIIGIIVPFLSAAAPVYITFFFHSYSRFFLPPDHRILLRNDDFDSHIVVTTTTTTAAADRP
jgi:hypothetical protein